VPGARLDAALLTAAAALLAAGRAPDLETGLADAREAVASGSASALLGRLREYTNAGVAA
jgi:anthranilate phosphoribosyltransferase